ncbi:ATP synthase F0 subunit A [Parabacteroides sp. An277]|nr:ATP synthase F0 subunit A [Parabacteroides sp. An277]
MDKARNNCWKWIAMLCLLLVGFQTKAEEAINVQEIVFSHIQDSYTWHITDWNEHEIAIPLPIIVKGEESGWHCFSSARLHKGATYENFSLAQEGEYAGKVVETLASGEVVRPIDISITKNVCGLLLACCLLLISILKTAHWYKKHPGEAPGGFVGMMEAVVNYIEEDVIRKSIGERDYKPFSSYLLTVFFFILINNLLGIIPIFPGGANVTGNIAVTMVLAVCTFLAVNLFGTKAYWKDIFWPNTPIFLKLPIPIMPFVEFFGIFTKPFALMIRLFANIMAGHTIILALTCLIFITVSMGIWVNMGMTLVSIAFCIFMNCLELFVACLQAYIFTLLSASYIGLAKVRE